MRPVAILQHDAPVSAGSFAAWAKSRKIDTQVVRIDQGEPLPVSSAAFSGICSLGGPMSVNDALPWIPAELALLRDAASTGVPVIGHCLGGQLLAKALGAAVHRHRVKEIGWMSVEVTDRALAHEWLGTENSSIEVFQWHGDSFELPRGARRFLGSPLCANQAYVIDGERCMHLGMQFHIEMTADLVKSWAADEATAMELADEREATGGPGVQDIATMLDHLEEHCARMRVFAEHAYDRWALGLQR